MIFVAQNRRRCHTGEDNIDIMKKEEPQVALFQPVAVARVNNNKVNDDDGSNNDTNHDFGEQRFRLASHADADIDGIETRFICRFHSIHDVPSKQQSTSSSSSVLKIDHGTTLSTYPFNPEYVDKLKQDKGGSDGDASMFYRAQEMIRKTKLNRAEKDKLKDMGSFWLSQLLFECPIPKNLQEKVKDGSFVISTSDDGNNHDGTTTSKQIPTLFVDVATIRTPVRIGRENFFSPEYQQHEDKGKKDKLQFDANEQWGTDHILPRFNDMGRWENIPICGIASGGNDRGGEKIELLKEPSLLLSSPQSIISHPDEDTTLLGRKEKEKKKKDEKKKPYRLVACTWTSASHRKRGDVISLVDGSERLREWIAFHLLVGFDHLYVYDNSANNRCTVDNDSDGNSDSEGDTSRNDCDEDGDGGKNGTTTTTKSKSYESPLRAVTKAFSSDQVTLIPWPFEICNNNRPAHSDPGERSSQYAAESSCRLRFGPETDWIANMDTDEYLVPMMGESKDDKEGLGLGLRENNGGIRGESEKDKGSDGGAWKTDDDKRNDGWKGVLDKLDIEGTKILKFRSTRARLRSDRVVPFHSGTDSGTCMSYAEDKSTATTEGGTDRKQGKKEKLFGPCLVKATNVTYLEAYNCEYIRSPKPERFQRAMVRRGYCR